MSFETPGGGKRANASLVELEAEERYARERYQLYKAKAYGSRLTSEARLRELERSSKLAKRRLDRARAAARVAPQALTRTNPIRKEHMPKTITPDQVVEAAAGLESPEFTRDDLAQKLGADKSAFSKEFRQARRAGRLDKVRDDEEGTGHFRLTDK